MTDSPARDLPERTHLKLTDLLERLRAKQSQALVGVPEQRQARFVRAVLQEIHDAIESSADDGTLVIAGLGRFKARPNDPKWASTPSEGLRRFSFMPLTPQPESPAEAPADPD